MKARNFRYIRPSSLDQACRILAEGGGDAVPVAGGQSLLAGLNMRLSAPKLLVDIGDLKELTGQSYEGGAVRLGALTRHAELLGSQVLEKHVPLLVRAAAHIGHVAIRNRGTLGGSLAYADPAAELPACAVALGATLALSSVVGEREVKAEDFFKGLFETELKRRADCRRQISSRATWNGRGIRRAVAPPRRFCLGWLGRAGDHAARSDRHGAARIFRVRRPRQSCARRFSRGDGACDAAAGYVRL
jgi:FAD binding domain in molybdopterin dehydrogenase